MSDAELDGRLSLHPEFKASIQYVGNERLPVVVVDNFLSRPEVLIDYAARHDGFSAVSDTLYPGIRAPIPAIYCFAVRAFLGSTVEQAFGLPAAGVTGELGHFCIVTVRPAGLHTLQRLPHFDTTNPKQLAVLHYLCDPRHGGTSFYRHRATRFEYVDDARNSRYQAAVGSELSSATPDVQYICGDTPLFERTATFAAAFNRVLIYRSNDLHSADIAPSFEFDADPRRGRLTANSFFYYR